MAQIPISTPKYAIYQKIITKINLLIKKFLHPLPPHNFLPTKKKQKKNKQIIQHQLKTKTNNLWDSITFTQKLGPCFKENNASKPSNDLKKMVFDVKHCSNKVPMGNPTSITRYLSFTASRDWLYRYTFSYAGLQSVMSDLGEGTTMHCWIPKVFKQSKPNLLLVHGFGANAMWQYADAIHHFIPKFNVFVPDLLFFGRSYTTQQERTEAFQARCLMKLMDIHGAQKLSFVGISYGGFVGYSLATQFPEAVEKAVLCCTGVCLEEKDMKEGLFKVRDLEEASKILMPQTPDKLRELMRLSFVRPPKGVPNWILADFINVMCKRHVKEKKELIEQILKDREVLKLPKISQPTMILWGEEDQIFPLELGYRLQRHLGSNAQLVVIKNAGHALNIEKSSEFVKHLKSFLIESQKTPPSTPSAKDPTTIEWWNH